MLDDCCFLAHCCHLLCNSLHLWNFNRCFFLPLVSHSLFSFISLVECNRKWRNWSNCIELRFFINLVFFLIEFRKNKYVTTLMLSNIFMYAHRADIWHICFLARPDVNKECAKYVREKMSIMCIQLSDQTRCLSLCYTKHVCIKMCFCLLVRFLLSYDHVRLQLKMRF